MLETIRIRKQGYPSRPKFKDFVYRYKVLGFPCRADVRGTAQSCRQILEQAGVDSYQVGKTKVFLKDKHAGELNQKIVGAELALKFPQESQTLGHAGRVNVYFGIAVYRCTVYARSVIVARP
jgi:hypothetical protein